VRTEYAVWYDADVNLRVAWYAEKSGPRLADRFVTAVEATVRKLKANPNRGRRPFPKDPDLLELYSVLVEHPFEKHILYYRFTVDTLILERLIHGARDLPRRLLEAPDNQV